MITPTVAGADTSANIQSASTGVSAQERQQRQLTSKSIL